MSEYLFTSESVSEGHPDKLADQVSDSILDAILAQDPTARVAAETLANTGLIVLAGEITTTANVDYIKVARETIKDIGYDNTEYGIDYKGWSLGRVKISPVAQVIFSERTGDSGAAANPANSGYQRILLSPGVEFHIHPVKLYADVELPVYQNVTGNQVVAPVLFKVSLSFMF